MKGIHKFEMYHKDFVIFKNKLSDFHEYFFNKNLSLVPVPIEIDVGTA